MRGRLVERLVFVGGLAVLIGAGVWLVASSDGSAPSTHVDDRPDGEAPNEASLELAGPLDGLESLQLPVTATPDIDLVDQQEIVISGTGFSQDAPIAIVQCWFVDSDSSRDDCDLGNIAVAFADEQGAFTQPMIVHQVIDTLNGIRDCAAVSDTEGCRIGVGNTLDLDESGGTEIFFATTDSPDPPRIEATPTNALVDGDVVTVTGHGFEPASQVMVTQCPVGGLDDASSGCLNRNPGELADIDANGDLSHSVVARRIRMSEDGRHDCALEVYGCMLVVRATAGVEANERRFGAPEDVSAGCVADGVDVCIVPAPPGRSPSPIPFDFDPSTGPPLPPEYTVTPSQGLVDGSSVRLEVFDMSADGEFEIVQCADGGPRGLFCEPLGTIAIGGGDGSADINVTRVLTSGADSIDCGEPARRCYLTLNDEPTEVVRGPLRFDG